MNDPESAYSLLKENNVLVGKTEVMAVQMEDKPGGLNKIATILGDAGVNIEYFYAFAIENKAILVLQVNQAHIGLAQSTLSENEITELGPDEIYSL